MPEINTSAFAPSVLSDAAKTLAGNRTLLEARKFRKIEDFFLDSGPCRRELYPRHLRFFAVGGQHVPDDECPPGCDGSPHRERGLFAGNRTGKTVAASFEVTCHLCGRYPFWWTGLRFDKPILAWVANDTNKNVRDVNQTELYGKFTEPGTGMVPAEYIISKSVKSGLSDAIDTLNVRHKSGGVSSVLFKSYEQGYEAFTGKAVEVIWCDEEPDKNVYAECCVRTMTTGGSVLLTFTPLQGVTEVIQGFYNEYQKPAE
jgi:phage terminase large subunit-like protein